MTCQSGQNDILPNARRPPFLQGGETAPGPANDETDPVLDAAILERWRIEGRARITSHWSELEELVAAVATLIDRKRYAQAAVAAQVAANHAVLWHPGLFAHADLEQLLRRLGEAALPFSGGAKRQDRKAGPMSVLHVATELVEIGGHTRMVARWIRHDAGNVHSLALTRQHMLVPERLRGPIGAGGGRIHRLNEKPGGLLSWARALQRLMAGADLVVLHVHSMDIVPFLALAGLERPPPVTLVNHADHLFFVGVDFVDQVIHTRRSGLRLSADRRGVAPERNVLLPLCLEPAARSRSRAEAKRELGLSPDCTVILTIARALKFRPVDGRTFADTLVPVLRQNPGARFIAVGPGGKVDWSAAQALVPGQIEVIAETPDTGLYLEAADIYVDSFPFVSITSLFEAGLHGLPLVSHNPFGRQCAIMGADSPGLDATILRARSPDDFSAILGRLVRDPHFRRLKGEETRSEIEAVNMGENWRGALLQTYEKVLSGRGPRNRIAERRPRFDDIDLFIPFVYGPSGRGATAASRMVIDVELVMKAAPLRWRLYTLAQLARRGHLHLLHSPVWRLLVPEWLGTRIRDLLPRGEHERGHGR